MAETGQSHGEIVTLSEERLIKVRSGTISVVPAWKWLLEPRD